MADRIRVTSLILGSLPRGERLVSLGVGHGLARSGFIDPTHLPPRVAPRFPAPPVVVCLWPCGRGYALAHAHRGRAFVSYQDTGVVKSVYPVGAVRTPCPVCLPTTGGDPRHGGGRTGHKGRLD